MATLIHPEDIAPSRRDDAATRRGPSEHANGAQLPSRRRPGDDSPAYAQELFNELQRSIEGEVRFDAGSRALYATDGSNYRQTPIGVVIPKNAEDIVKAIALCRSY